MEVLSPASYVSKTPWLIDTRKNTKWTQQENKMFENALAYYDKDTPDRWHKVAEMIPGKTAEDVRRQYQELVYDVRNIEAGLVRVPEYGGSQFTLEWVSHNGCGSGAKRGPSSRGSDHERKKGIPWTEEEHRLFLMGLKKYGKGDWRNISRNFVMTRTPTQVASHAQKYFIRQLSGGKDKRRASIHDITTVTLDTNQVPSPDARRPSSPEHSTVTVQPPQRRPGSIPKFPTFPWDRAGSGLGHVTGSMFISPYGMQGQNLHDHHDGCHGMGMAFQMQATEHYPHG